MWYLNIKLALSSHVSHWKKNQQIYIFVAFAKRYLLQREIFFQQICIVPILYQIVLCANYYQD